VVLTDGQVLYHPGPVPKGPWVPLENHWVQPEHIKAGKDPSGFFLSTRQPAPAATVQMPRPEPLLWVKDDVMYFDSGKKAELTLPPDQFPFLIRLSRSLLVNKNRIEFTNDRILRLDGGQKFPIESSRHIQQLKKEFRTPSLQEHGPEHYPLRLMRLRDYPYEIASAEADRLKADFPVLDWLLNNIIWQAWSIRNQTGKMPYGNTFKGFFYRPVLAILYRAGFLSEEVNRNRHTREKIYLRFCTAIYRMVFQHKFFTYEQFGFKDAFPEQRLMGSHKILVVEKGEQLEEFGRQLQAELGMSLMVLKGAPSLMATEYFAKDFRKLHQGPVEIYFYGDFDFGGWDIATAVRRQLLFYGIACNRLERLILPECFTAQELKLYSRPIPKPSLSVAGRVERWLRESGGIQGQARGIYANALQPYERVRARLLELMK
jgi:hypothetical protein